MKTVILFDYDAYKEAADKLDVEVNVEQLTEILKSINEESEHQSTYAYVGINEKLPHVKDRTVDTLQRAGYIVRSVVGQNFGMSFISDTTQAITLDALRCVYENSSTHVVLVSNSHRLENLVLALREKDVTVETVFFGSQVDYDLAVSSTGFIDLESFITSDDEEQEQKEDAFTSLISMYESDDEGKTPIEETEEPSEAQEVEDNELVETLNNESEDK